jgi:hypothetical protein
MHTRANGGPNTIHMHAQLQLDILQALWEAALQLLWSVKVKVLSGWLSEHVADVSNVAQATY